ncbi:hypothetical protein VHTUMSATKI_38410 [Vibrio harveyi]
MSEFLLVPFYGACIHVPPSPPNQIIHVKFEEETPTKDLWDIVSFTSWARFRLKPWLLKSWALNLVIQ